jgi:alanine racemase
MSGKRKQTPTVNGRPVWAEVSLGALKENFEAIRRFVNPPREKRATPRKILCVVKGNAYGHGAPQTAKALEKFGSDWFGVTSAGEGAALRAAGVRKPILVLTSFWAGEENDVLRHKLTPAVIRCDQLEQLESAAARRKMPRGSVDFHLKVDTGMNRLGIAPSDVDCFVRQLAKSPHLRMSGVFTHLASSEVFAPGMQGNQTRAQEEQLRRALDRLRALGVDHGLVHLANSAAIASRPDTWADMVRPGAILYGYHPGFDPQERREQAERDLPLRPVLSLRSRIVSIKEIGAGEGVGYNAKFIAEKPARIGVLAAGYGDGIHRSLGNRGSVLVHGVLAPIVGIVSMDVTMIDITGVPGVALGDVVTVYGVEGQKTHPANAIARSIGTVTSDLLCAISQRVPRIYVA